MSKNITLTAISSHIVVIFEEGSDKANIFLVLFCTTLHSVSSMAVHTGVRLLISLDTAPWRAERRWFVRPSASHCNAGGAEGARMPA